MLGKIVEENDSRPFYQSPSMFSTLVNNKFLILLQIGLKTNANKMKNWYLLFNKLNYTIKHRGHGKVFIIMIKVLVLDLKNIVICQLNFQLISIMYIHWYASFHIHTLARNFPSLVTQWAKSSRHIMYNALFKYANHFLLDKCIIVCYHACYVIMIIYEW